ncbi:MULTISPECIES: hypothetical protein [unclassified Streptomyces]|uniref:hypothetical protein n=1 Tax=unclassified Streptomyces TaxID=2593676 RepID=UPI000DB93E2C|nr:MULTISPECIES: hypothetical protein [unclassified Streptomyces]MYT74771.1 hypothetical protein [Streptomyces sp. SID8367]RAJ91758.1 hypothetical protein K377_00527 [Streptomyces sp. PsTaAH-137]
MSDPRWTELPASVRDATDAHVLADALLPAALVLVRHGLNLRDAQLTVHERYEHLRDRVARRPEPPLGVDELAARAADAPGPVVRIAAEWDGDTVHDWFVDLIAVTSTGHHSLTTVTWGAAHRRLTEAEAGSAHPVAVLAARLGSELAARLGVPFRFDSPDEPGGAAPQPNTR